MSEIFDVNQITEGTQLGHYVIMEEIAEGGMGKVYKGFEPALERYVAIKVLRAEYAQNEEHIQYFQEEARAIAALRHPNIVPIYFIGRENNIAYFSMAFIDGRTFDDWIEAGRRMTSTEAVWFLNQAVAALDCAIHSNIVHLDIKPSNFLIDANNVVMLTDFGLAQRLGKIVLDEEREVFGTPAYVSPEQINKEPTDQRTDIYSLGATLFHLMAGSPPYDGDSVEEIVLGHLQKTFPEAAAQKARLSQGWISLLQKMMERNPQDRFQDYRELHDALGQVDNYRYETQSIQRPDAAATKQFLAVQPRSQRPVNLLYGLLPDTNADWAQVKGNTASQSYTRTQVLQTLKDQAQNKPLKVEPLVNTIRDMCSGVEGEPNDMLQSMEEIPGLRNTMFLLAYFIAQEEADQVTNDEEALYMVGLSRARNLALFHFSLAFEWHPIKSFDFLPMWQHQLATALIVDLLYDALVLKRTGIEFVAGLYHDIGKLILSEMYPYGYYGALNRSIIEEASLSQCEIDFMGMNHAQMGEYWLRERRLPYALVDVIAHHEDPDLSRKHALLAHAVCSANHLAKQLGFGYSGNAIMDSCSWEQHPSTEYLWESRGHDEFTWEEFSHNFLSQLGSFPDLLTQP
jgi:serine/threonine protein kinase